MKPKSNTSKQNLKTLWHLQFPDLSLNPQLASSHLSQGITYDRKRHNEQQYIGQKFGNILIVKTFITVRDDFRTKALVSADVVSTATEYKHEEKGDDPSNDHTNRSR